MQSNFTFVVKFSFTAFDSLTLKTPFFVYLKDGKVETITVGVTKVLDEYNMKNEIKMIFANMTNINTGKKNRVATKPYFVSYHHHNLDRIPQT